MNIYWYVKIIWKWRVKSKQFIKKKWVMLIEAENEIFTFIVIEKLVWWKNNKFESNYNFNLTNEVLF